MTKALPRYDRIRNLFALQSPNWGTPIDLSARPGWPHYHSSLWRPRAPEAGIYMVDGWFQAACLAQIILRCRSDSMTDVHDFPSRLEHYRASEITNETASAEGKSFFQPLQNIDGKAHRKSAENIINRAKLTDALAWL